MKKYLFVLVAIALSLTACKSETVENTASVDGVVMDCSRSSIVLISTDSDRKILDTLIFSFSDLAQPDSVQACEMNDFVRIKYSTEEPYSGTVLSLKVQSHLVSLFVSAVKTDAVSGNSDDEGALRILAPAAADSTFFATVSEGDELFLSCLPDSVEAYDDTLTYRAVEILKEY